MPSGSSLNPTGKFASVMSYADTSKLIIVRPDGVSCSSEVGCSSIIRRRLSGFFPAAAIADCISSICSGCTGIG